MDEEQLTERGTLPPPTGEPSLELAAPPTDADRHWVYRFRYLVALVAVGALVMLIVIVNADWGGSAGSSTVTSVVQGGPACRSDDLTGTIAFEQTNEIYVANADGSGKPRRIQDDVMRGRPDWSPDGTRIAYGTGTSMDDDIEVAVMSDSGKNATTLTSEPHSFGPAWSPDGSKIAFTTDRDGDDEVYVMNADGSDQRNVTNMPYGSDHSPVWSPDGTRIAFASNRDGDSEIYVMNAMGTSQQNVTNTPLDNEDAPAWSPDGTRIAFSEGWDIFVMNAAGVGRSNLTKGRYTASYPAWSPDGTTIIFGSVGQGTYGLFVMNADGTDQRCIGFPDAEHPSWRE